ncbi:MAG TPA: primase-helicase family protein [Geminicoccus sp.]|jgi:hypothetical protein|uniref:primase-helicase family protein n=1 Tax=Geminicoccus sp. TaxID=2024832 RepID=UPI002E36D120|nr:primase-helicase family protein [Geminicoccus sp.]HEX2525293.1 primase-helicase family protein [Geminicoccus sp.]
MAALNWNATEGQGQASPPGIDLNDAGPQRTESSSRHSSLDQTEIRLTRVKKQGGALLCKRISLGEDGTPKSDGSPCAMARGTAMRVRLNGSPAKNLATQILDLGSDEALVLGDLRADLPDKIALERDEVADPANGTHGRTRKTFRFPDGAPSVVLLDYDQKAMPADVRRRLEEVGGFEGALAALIPDFAALARVQRASTSAGLYNIETGERFPGNGGLHAYLFVEDGADIRRFLDTLQKRAWSAGLGWIMVAERGALLTRSIIDTSVGSPERLVFEGPPAVVAPLAQDQAERTPIAHEGARLDTRQAVPPLTADEEAQFTKLVTAAKLAAKPEAEAAIEKAAEAFAHSRGIDVAEARTIIVSSLEHKLVSRDVLEFDDDTTASVADILADPGRYRGTTLADPLEGRGYGRGKAKVYWNSNGSVIINSFAHGNIVYRLAHDAAFIEAQITQAGETAPFVLAKLMPHARDLDLVTCERLRNLAAKLAGVSRRAVKATIEQAGVKARQEALQDAKARPPDEQPDAPSGETGPHVEAADAAQPVGDWRERLDRMVETMNATYFVAAMGGTTRIASVEYDEVLKRERLVFSRQADIKLLFNHRHYMTGYTQKGAQIWKDQGTAWVEHVKRRTYRCIALIPSGPCPPDTYNLWRGFGVVPCPGLWPKIQYHLKQIICGGSEDHYDWLIQWMAYCVQQPGKQAETAVVLRGLKGAGKGMFADIMKGFFRGHSLHISNPKHLVGNFNAHLVDALFLFLDEALWGGDKAGEGVLKTVVTERTLMIEPKGVDPFQVPNRLKIVMSSNNEWVVPVSAEERRYFVLDVSDAKKGDKKYFIDLAAAIEGDELAAMLHDLLAMDLSEFNHREPPHTEGLNRQKLIGADSFTKFWYDCLMMGDLLGIGEADWPIDVVCEELRGAYVEYAKQHGDRHPITLNQIGVKLRELSPSGFETFRSREPWNGKPRPTRYQLFSLDEHREAFLKAMKIDPAGHQWVVDADDAA